MVIGECLVETREEWQVFKCDPKYEFNYLKCGF